VKFDPHSGRYRYRTIDGSSMYINKNFMNAIIKAESIRKIFFTSKGDFLGTYFYIKPYSLGRKLSLMELHYDENYIAYAHGPIKSRKVVWPPESQNNIAKFDMYNLQNKRIVEISEEGAWGFFKLLDHFTIKNYQIRYGTDSIIFEYRQKYYKGSYNLSGRVAKIFTKNNPLKRFKLESGL
jgi:type VI secretion system protein ImpL